MISCVARVPSSAIGPAGAGSLRPCGLAFSSSARLSALRSRTVREATAQTLDLATTEPERSYLAARLAEAEDTRGS